MDKKTSYKCGYCGKKGHNSRGCDKVNKTITEKTASVIDKTESVSSHVAEIPTANNPTPAAETPPVVEQAPVKEHVATIVALNASTIDISAATPVTSSPVKGFGKFRCPNCNQVGVLVVVAMPADSKGTHKQVMKCEFCHNKAPAHSIITWGATPNAVPPIR